MSCLVMEQSWSGLEPARGPEGVGQRASPCTRYEARAEALWRDYQIEKHKVAGKLRRNG
jgi:hypothetical protein